MVTSPNVKAYLPYDPTSLQLRLQRQKKYNIGLFVLCVIENNEVNS